MRSISEHTWDTDPDLEVFRKLMFTYETLRDSITEDAIPVERHWDGDDTGPKMVVPKIQAQMQLHQKRLDELRAKHSTEFDAATQDLNTRLGETIQAAKVEMQILKLREQDAITKWNYFVHIIDEIVASKYQQRHYIPVVFDNSGLQRRGRIYWDEENRRVDTTFPLEIAQCTLKQTLLNGPFRK